MPKIDTYTAPGVRAIQEVVRPSPESFGHSAFGQVGELGKQFQEIGHKIQDNQDKLDVLKLSGDYAIRLDQAKSAILLNPDPAQHAELFAKASEQIHETLLKENPTVSPAVQTTFAQHVAQQYAPGAIDLAHQGRTLQVERQVVDATNRVQTIAATQAGLDPASLYSRDMGHRPGQAIETSNHIIQSFVDNGTLHPLMAEKMREQVAHNYWTLRAALYPEHVMAQIHAGKLAKDDYPMNPFQAEHYNAIAVNTLHARQAQADQARIAEERALKARQEINKSQFQADVIAGKPVIGQLESLVRSREIDGDAITPLLALQKTLTEVPNMALYRRGLATQYEVHLSASKYDNQPFNPDVLTSLQSDYLQGHILKEEFTHLGALARAVQAHKEDVLQTPRNNDIAHAVSNLDEVMQSANKLTGFSAVGNQATANAKEYFYRRVQQEPTVNPWEVMHDAEARFKPIVEKQQGISKVDQMLLNDAKMEANVKLGVVSKAAAKTYRDTTQDERGRKAVNDALKALPPPPEPGFFERLFHKMESSKARTVPGVMGE